MIFLYLFMKPAITITIILGTILTFLIFISAIFFVLHMETIIKWLTETVEEIFMNRRRRDRIMRRRNAIYVYPQRIIREIELTPIPKKNFIIIENPSSPYTLGIEYSTE
jgi:hypothetical protein